MLDLIFFSTNSTKVAHFRYLGSKLGFKIKSFREANYYASYDEPRIDNRSDLLRQSYNSALIQWRRRQRKLDDEMSTFFFEDTSVRIDALSEDLETPGVNVKFWMREMTFRKLDELLKNKGNDRRATVRSDIIMHLPRKWRDLLGTSEDYLWVHGEVSGQVTNFEEKIYPNLVYTWLDDKSFNKWFVPDGANHPVSALNIHDADKYDFRSKAFEQITHVLHKLKFIQPRMPQSIFQLELPRVHAFPSVFVICGPTCAGKTTSAKWMTDTFGIPHLEASDFMYKAFWERHGLRSKYKIGDFAEVALKTQPEIVASPIVNHILEKQLNIVVVTGFRSPTEIDIFKSELPAEMKLEVIYLDSDKDIRLARAIKRNRDDINSEKFDSRNAQEERMGLLKIEKINRVSHILNNTTTSSLFSKYRKKFRGAFKTQTLPANRFKIEANLEPLILITLLDLQDSTQWLTTTELASVLNAKFNEKKNKNNISRYFNQEYHYYFEVRLRELAGRTTSTVEYRLSATGISEAKLLKTVHSNWLSPRKSPAKADNRQLSLFE